MTTIDTHADARGRSVVEAFLVGVGAWATTSDHKRIGRIYLGFGLFGVLGGAVLGALLGSERLSSSSVFDGDVLVQLFQAYRITLVFVGLLPLALGLAIAVVPLQLGARQIAFPRLALTGCYAWLGGLVLTFAALARNGGMGGGDDQAVDLFLAGHGLMILGLLASAGSLAASVLTTRAPGMTMRRVPLFAWSCLIAALGILIALPVAFGTIVYLFIDHRLGLRENFGGAEGIAAWLGWIYSVPAVVVFALPAVGVAAELLPVTFRQRMPLRGVAFAGIALVGVSALAAATQQADGFPVSFDSDQSFGRFFDDVVPFLIFAGLPVLGLLVVMGLGALTARTGAAHGAPKVTAAFVLSFLGLGMVFLGLIANVVQNLADLEALGTSFEEATTLLVVYGATMSLLGGVVFWAPKLWGRTLPDKRVLPLVLLALGGTVVASVPLAIAGLLDQAGGIPTNQAQVDSLLSLDYAGSAELWNSLSMIGHVMMVVAVLAFVLLMLQAFTGRGDAAAGNPYGGHTIEWSTASPAPADNFEHVPTVASATPQFDMTYEGSLS